MVFSAKDGDGTDMTQVSVSVDGKVLTSTLDGHAIEMTRAPASSSSPPPTDAGPSSMRPSTRARRRSACPRASRRSAGTEAAPVRTWRRRRGDRPFAPLASSSAAWGLRRSRWDRSSGSWRFSKNSDSNANGHCDASGCDATGTSLRNTALSDATVSTITFVAGGVLAAAGVVLVVVSLHPKAPTTGRLELRPTASPNAGGLNLAGSW